MSVVFLYYSRYGPRASRMSKFSRTMTLCVLTQALESESVFARVFFIDFFDKF